MNVIIVSKLHRLKSFQFYKISQRHMSFNGPNSPANLLLVQRIIQGNKKNTNGPNCVLWGEVTGDRQIPLTKGQKLAKHFHIVVS